MEHRILCAFMSLHVLKLTRISDIVFSPNSTTAYMTQITKPQARLAGQAGCITIALCLVMLPLATALPAPVPQEVPNVASTIAPSGTTTPGPSTVSASASSSPSASRGLPMQTGYIVLIGLGSIVTVATLVSNCLGTCVALTSRCSSRVGQSPANSRCGGGPKASLLPALRPIRLLLMQQP